MSSGEADAATFAREALARSASLDAFVRCTAAACEVRVHISAPAPVRCRLHGGPRVPQYETSADDGGFLWSAYLRVTTLDLGGDDCE